MTSPPEGETLAPGARIGRYVVTDPIGHGGLGAVFLAYDPELARRVAIKVIRAGVVSRHAHARMVREARAMAQLSHPNVVAIYDVGMHRNSVYIAMEYVDGETLETWMATPRSRREVLAVMRQAGRGLAAAHAAGIVHRDFKPANIVIAKDARVRVLDFGIAFGDPLRDARAPADAGNVRGLAPCVPDSDPSSARLTEEGAIVGTVGYFAPETIFDQPADARADIFSFCVTLWRALTGRSPFPETSVREYLDAIFLEPRARLRDPSVPDWLATAIDRGLRASPADRYATVDELLGALDETEGWKAPIAIGVFALAIAMTAGVTMSNARRDAEVGHMCRVEADAIATSWSPSAREAARRAMLAEADPNAQARTAETLARLDGYARDWRSEEAASCEATLIAKTLPEALHERRSQCLVDGRVQLEVVAETLARADGRAHRASLRAADAIPPPHRCVEVVADPSFAPLPEDPDARDAVMSARREAIVARVMLSVGAEDDARRAAERAISIAQHGGDTGLEASAEHLLGSIVARDPEEALAHERRAIALAEATGADHVGALAATSTASLLAPKRPDEAAAWQALARGKLARLGDDPVVEEAILHTDVTLANAGGEWHAIR